MFLFDTHTQPNCVQTIQSTHPQAHVKIYVHNTGRFFHFTENKKMIPLSRSRRKNGGGQYKNLISFFNRKRQKSISIFVILFVLCMIVLNTSYPMRNTERTSTSTRRKYDFKIFVYDLPPWANKMILERDPECRNSVFATEIVIHEQIMRNSHGILTRTGSRFSSAPPRLSGGQRFRVLEKYRFIVKSVLDFVMKKLTGIARVVAIIFGPWYMISELVCLGWTTTIVFTFPRCTARSFYLILAI